ncbi:hypothetical protein MA16_Dca012158 [Dendrobium catenatum]|uniref:Uncharacterized protein n=1 Tax=Dendrobium catenatum TaxID=906689 RepID=A0A2I0VF48_9ASPA|nr:hypothetical protein MA16_Dca012158 [Dendrobium catenatum]
MGAVGGSASTSSRASTFPNGERLAGGAQAVRMKRPRVGGSSPSGRPFLRLRLHQWCTSSEGGTVGIPSSCAAPVVSSRCARDPVRGPIRPPLVGSSLLLVDRCRYNAQPVP